MAFLIRELNELVGVTSFNSEGCPCILKGVLKLLHLSKPYAIFKGYSNVLDERSRSSLNKRSVGC